ncbi:VOC family protein [Pedobacter polaris]|uniref:VOC family protein n=1 Tax=Pedobacter polaris TaxID=2571273 RepID=A0A4U1CWT9_9SPHI|nr:VOC family protein [Pedobacter polaris]TKC13236.1 VOC family protein [Pedobacter polaris]
MATTNTYLTFNGNCEEAFTFYKSVFGGEFNYIGRFNEMPPQEGSEAMSEEDGNKIMHVSLPIGTSILMGSDTGGEWASSFVPGNNFSISITAASKAEADQLFLGLADGGTITMPLNDTFWGDYFGMLTDKFGINWMMSFNENTAQ